MMKHREGFTLVECLVYCVLFCAISIALFSWIGASHIRLFESRTKIRALLNAHGSCDVFMRDCMQAPSDKKFWKVVKSDCLIWSTIQEDIGWVKQGRSLYRLAGRYSEDKWLESTKSLIDTSIENCVFTVLCTQSGDVYKIKIVINNISQEFLLGNKRYTIQ